MKLLIIEDDPNYADIMACRMKRHGYECETINHADLVLHEQGYGNRLIFYWT